MYGPPLAPVTIKRKGNARKLIDKGKMMNSFDYEVNNGELKVGSDYTVGGLSKPLCEIHEDGAGHIPARPMLKAVFVTEEAYIEAILKGSGEGGGK
jgi:hypothetical protein